MSSATKTAQMILQRLGMRRDGKLFADRATVPIEDLEDLARDYISVAGSTTGAPLGKSGPLYVSLAAAREYKAAERIETDEDARRELHEMLLDAKQSATDSSEWRYRNRSTGLDIAARVEADGRLLVVTRVAVRPANTGGRRG